MSKGFKVKCMVFRDFVTLEQNRHHVGTKPPQNTHDRLLEGSVIASLNRHHGYQSRQNVTHAFLGHFRAGHFVNVRLAN